MIGAGGIEPASAVYKTAALPLDEAPLKTVCFEAEITEIKSVQITCNRISRVTDGI